jgi:phosphatidylserine/phosphatidylglycerophosphate/cardiolipin synthase-like enzyme
MPNTQPIDLLNALTQLHTKVKALHDSALNNDWEYVMASFAAFDEISLFIQQYWPIGQRLDCDSNTQSHLRQLIQEILEYQNSIQHLAAPVLAETKKNLGSVHTEKRLQHAYGVFSS